jgi:hypothetical protein
LREKGGRGALRKGQAAGVSSLPPLRFSAC